MDGLQHIHRQVAYHLPCQPELFEDAVWHFLLGEFVSVHSSSFNGYTRTNVRRLQAAKESARINLPGFRLNYVGNRKSYCQSYFKRRMGLPKARSCREAPFRYKFFYFSGEIRAFQPWSLHTFDSCWLGCRVLSLTAGLQLSREKYTRA